MPRDADIVVIGAGVVGAATAYALSRRGGTVLLLDQFQRGHSLGSSHGTSRIFRLNYPDERFVRLAQAADEAWRELERERGRAADRARRVARPRAARRRDRTRSRSLRRSLRDDVRRRGRAPLAAPARRRRDGRLPVRREGSCTRIAHTLRSSTRLSTRASRCAPTHGSRALEVESRQVRLDLADGTIAASAAVVTAGAWARELLATAEIELPVVPTRETVLYLDLPGAAPVPAVIDYGRLPSPGTGGITRAGQRGVRARGARCRPQGGPAPLGARGRPGRRPGPGRARRRMGRRVGVRAVRRRRRDASDGDLPLHEHRRRGVRAGAPRTRRRRLCMLRPRLQVRPGRRPHARRARARGGVLISEQLRCTMRDDDTARRDVVLAILCACSRPGATATSAEPPPTVTDASPPPPQVDVRRGLLSPGRRGRAGSAHGRRRARSRALGDRGAARPARPPPRSRRPRDARSRPGPRSRRHASTTASRRWISAGRSTTAAGAPRCSVASRRSSPR